MKYPRYVMLYNIPEVSKVCTNLYTKSTMVDEDVLHSGSVTINCDFTKFCYFVETPFNSKYNEFIVLSAYYST